MVKELLESALNVNDKAKFVLFVDIGGNRELEALVALLPWLTK
jgi:hypothetical protein